MKTMYSVSKVIVLLIALLPTSFLKATNYSSNGGNKSYSLASGDTLFIQQGTYTGSITLPAGAVVVVAANSTFTPSALNLWAPAGKLINNGTATLGAMGIGGGFSLENTGSLTVNGDMSFYSGTAKSLVNYSGATITVNGALTASDNTTVTNMGTIITTAAFSSYASSAMVSNKGTIAVGGSFNNQGTLSNENIIRVAGDFNYWAGTVANTGLIEPNGNFVVGSGLSYTNSCKLITKGGLNNSGTFQNNGLVWAGTSGTSSDQLTNSGSFINATGAKIKTVAFTNYGTITGAGFIYATGVTTLGGHAIIGVTGTTSDTIKIYDVTRSNPSNIFDNQWGTVNPNTKYSAFAAPDSNQVFSGCSAIFKSVSAASPLPVVWNYFYLKTINNQPALYWSAEYEKGMKFETQRSFDGIHFSAIGTLTSNTSTTYSFTDETLGSTAIAYYRIKGTSTDGSVKYTEIRRFQGNDTEKAGLAVYPNPTKGALNISYTASTSTSVLVRIATINGQQLILKSVGMTTGTNRITIAEAASLPAGIYTIDLIKGTEIIATEKFVKQ